MFISEEFDPGQTELAYGARQSGERHEPGYFADIFNVDNGKVLW